MQWISLALGCFLANFLYGILAKLRIVDTTRFKVAHHILYFCVMASLGLAIGMEVWKGAMPVPLVMLFVMLFGMTRFSGKTRRHWQYAVWCLVAYLGVFALYLFGLSNNLMSFAK